MDLCYSGIGNSIFKGIELMCIYYGSDSETFI